MKTINNHLLSVLLILLNSSSFLIASNPCFYEQMDKKMRFQASMVSELARAFKNMDGIVDVDMQVSFPESEQLEDKITLSIHFKHCGILDNPNNIGWIKRYISRCLPGLDEEQITVIVERVQ